MKKIILLISSTLVYNISIAQKVKGVVIYNSQPGITVPGGKLPAESASARYGYDVPCQVQC